MTQPHGNPRYSDSAIKTLQDLPVRWVLCRGKVAFESQWQTKELDPAALEAHGISGEPVGFVPGSIGLAALDVDEAGGIAPPFPDSVILQLPRPLASYRSLSGKWHLLYRAPDWEVRNQRFALAGCAGEVRGHRGYLILPGDDAVAALKRAHGLLEWGVDYGRWPLPDPTPLPVAPTPTTPPTDDVAAKRVLAAMEKKLDAVRRAQPGDRNNRLSDASYWGAKLANAHGHRELVRAALIDAAGACGLGEQEALKCIDSKLRTVKESVTLEDRPHPSQKPQDALSGDLGDDPTPTPSLVVTSMEEAMERFERGEYEVKWITEGFTPASGTSLLAATPKTGKSVFARAEAAAIITNNSFFGAATTPTNVLLLALDEAGQSVFGHFHRLWGNAGYGDRFAHLDVVEPGNLLPDRWQTQLMEQFERRHYGLVIADMMVNLMPGVQDLNDYKSVFEAMGVFRTIAAKLDTHFRLVHHYNKGEGRGVDRVMGSAAIAGAVDQLILLDQTPQGKRFYQVAGRLTNDDTQWAYGLGTDSGLLSRLGRRGEGSVHEGEITRWVRQHLLFGEPFTAKEVQSEIATDCTVKTVKRELEKLVVAGDLTKKRVGTGDIYSAGRS